MKYLVVTSDKEGNKLFWTGRRGPLSGKPKWTKERAGAYEFTEKGAAERSLRVNFTSTYASVEETEEYVKKISILHMEQSTTDRE